MIKVCYVNNTYSQTWSLNLGRREHYFIFSLIFNCMNIKNDKKLIELILDKHKKMNN